MQFFRLLCIIFLIVLTGCAVAPSSNMSILNKVSNLDQKIIPMVRHDAYRTYLLVVAGSVFKENPKLWDGLTEKDWSQASIHDQSKIQVSCSIQPLYAGVTVSCSEDATRIETAYPLRISSKESVLRIVDLIESTIVQLEDLAMIQ